MAGSSLVTAALAASAALVASACASHPVALTTVAETSLAVRASDGTRVRIADLSRAQPATVLVFWSASCPCVRRYQTRVEALGLRYPAGRVRVLAVSSNADESFEDALAESTRRGLRTPLYRDDGGQLAAALGARSTPTVVVLDGSGAVRFVGWIDNEHEPGDPARQRWLEQAIDGVLTGTRFEARTRTFGCAITRATIREQSPCCADPTNRDDHAPPRTSR